MKLFPTTIHLVETDDRYIATAIWCDGNTPQSFTTEAITEVTAPSDLLANFIDDIAVIQFTAQQNKG